MATPTFKEYFEKFEKMQSFIINDLKKTSINANANFLVAMGLFNYIEILGSFGIDNNKNRKRFNFVFEELLPKEYKKVFDEIEKRLKCNPTYSSRNNPTPVYDILRYGMSHEYLAKTINNIEISYRILNEINEENYEKIIKEKVCGIELLDFGNEWRITIFNPRFIHDLNIAFEDFKKKLFDASNSDYRKYFETRCCEIKIDRLE